MADINAIKIHDLDSIDYTETHPLDEIVINDVSAANNSNIETKKITVDGLEKYYCNKNLVINGDITLSGNVSPDLTKSLDLTANDVIITEKLTLTNTCQVTGFKLNTDVDDVEIDFLKNGDFLVWNSSASDGDGAWINYDYDFTKNYIEDAPVDGKIYARQNAKWVDITELLRPDPETGEGPGFILGDPSIRKVSVGDILVNEPIVFICDVEGQLPPDIQFEWISDTAEFASPNSQATNVVFRSVDSHIITCRVTSNEANNSPRSASVLVYATDTYNVLGNDTDNITDLGLDGAFITNEGGVLRLSLEDDQR